MELVSVLMCVYNTNVDYLKEAIESILNQTYRNFEFIIVNDASSNKDILNLIKQYDDKRIKLINNDKNYGLTKSLNIGLKQCKGRYIARMDADDVSKSDRIEKQIKYIKENNYAVVGSRFSYIPYTRFNMFENNNLYVNKIRMIFGNTGIIHSSAFIDGNVLKKHGITYNEKYKKSQDYGLWCELLTKGEKIGVCPYVLVNWRRSDNQISVKNKEEQTYYKLIIRKKYLFDNFNVNNIIIEKYLRDDLYLKFNSNLKLEKCINRFIENNISENPYLEKEICRYWVIQMFLRCKHLKTFDMLKSSFIKKVLKPSNFIYVIKSVLSERVVI